MCCVALFCCLPILIWNAENHWITFNHVIALAGFGPRVAEDAAREPNIHWLGPIVYPASQAALLLGFWFISWVMAMVAYRPNVEKDPGLNYLWWLSAPMFACFWAFSLKTGGGEVNWPVTAYLSGLVLAAIWLGRQLESSSDRYRRFTQVSLVAVGILGVTITLVLHHSELVHPLLARFAGAPTLENRFPLRKLDPTCRLRGWKTLAAAVDAERDRLQAQGSGEVVLAGHSWTMPGELAVYCKGHPHAYTLGPLMGDRHSQYDLWPGPLSDPEPFRGRTFLLVGDPFSALSAGFDRVEPTREIVHYEDGQPICCWYLTVCRGYKGYPPWMLDGRKY
jgi:hypothetical protein